MGDPVSISSAKVIAINAAFDTVEKRAAFVALYLSRRSEYALLMAEVQRDRSETLLKMATDELERLRGLTR